MRDSLWLSSSNSHATVGDLYNFVTHGGSEMALVVVAESGRQGEGTSSVNKTTREAVAGCSKRLAAVASPKSLYRPSPLTHRNYGPPVRTRRPRLSLKFRLSSTLLLAIQLLLWHSRNTASRISIPFDFQRVQKNS